ncbi:DNA-binding TFAR19-related protein (PDSD5 family) [Arthrobacter stackebrandtii]|uniref:DNA-binding TFAR19-related protein (PDSD5 family) n=1 Tax=Arthrobacter stackebrandtii TaxID=272161 RepID=A0ABS4YVL5_9MICC|nr:type I restriction enzyme HsdR N-terminal domain-containing protein [Arthrobacter stackebrandtii]MBP2412769.1 DNA-binding TFAR19-related protein (PDSD5 family) [Arthrobacter stackebrandtii]
MTAEVLDAKGQKRFQVLLEWSRHAAAAGHAVPDDATLEAIAHTRVVVAEGSGGALAARWEETIVWLLKQAAFGVNAPHLQLPDELGAPAAAEPAGISAGVVQAEEPEAAAEVPAEVPAAAPVKEAASEAAAAPAPAPGAAAASKAKANPPPASRLPKWELAAIEQVREAIQRYVKPLEALRARDANEGDTRMVVTDMLCEGLDFDKFKDLTTEYMVKQDFADYGVRIDKQMVAFIEVKRISQKLNERHLRQVLMYAVNEGVEWMVLTNGAVWQAYHLTGGLPVVVDMAFEIDLLGPATLAEKTDSMFLLHKEALKRRRIDEVWRHRAATEPGALLDVMLSEPMLDELRKEVRRRTGIATTAQALSEVIRTEIVDPKLIAKLFKA